MDRRHIDSGIGSILWNGKHDAIQMDQIPNAVQNGRQCEYDCALVDNAMAKSIYERIEHTVESSCCI